MHRKKTSGNQIRLPEVDKSLFHCPLDGEQIEALSVRLLFMPIVLHELIREGLDLLLLDFVAQSHDQLQGL